MPFFSYRRKKYRTGENATQGSAFPLVEAVFGKQLVEIFLTRNIVGAGCRNTARRRKRASLVVSQLRRFMTSGLT